MPRDRQSEAEPSMLSCRTAVSLPKPIEHERQELDVDSDPRVFHLDRDDALCRSAADLDPATFRRELDRVRDDVAEHLLKALRIALDGRQVVGKTLRHVNLLLSR